MRLRTALVLAALSCAGTGVAVAHEAGSAGKPRCHGAADRDPRVPCRNPALRKKVSPTPNKAQLTPNLACTRDRFEQVVQECAFGASPEEATATVAIVGDSHAAHWHSAMAVMAAAKGWRVLEIAPPHCPFTMAAQDSGPEVARWCPQWNRDLIEWLGAHPEVRTVFLAAHAQAPIVVPKGEDPFTVRVQGYLDAWQQLPASVQELVVIRDNPLDRVSTFDCVRRAIRKKKPAGRRCATPRKRVLVPDAQEVAAQRMHGRGARVIDLTPHFCSRRRCYPVVGGVLVHKDTDHLSQPFARSLGPYLLRGYDELARP